LLSFSTLSIVPITFTPATANIIYLIKTKKQEKKYYEFFTQKNSFISFISF
jgi:hypothetical protein